MHVYQYAIWIFSPLLQLSILWSVWRKGLVREYPTFFLYCSYSVVSALVAFILRHTSEFWYFYFAWTTELLGSVLLIAVIQSLLQLPMRTLGSLAGICNLLFYALGVLAIGVILWAASGNHAFEEFDLIRKLIAFDNGLRFVQGALLVLVAFLALRFSLQWQPLAKYILAGTALMVIGGLAVTTIRATVGAEANTFLRFFRPTAYVLGVCFWFFFICVAHPRESEVHPGHLKDLRKSLEEVAR